VYEPKKRHSTEKRRSGGASVRFDSSGSAAPLGAIPDLIPIAFPLFAPIKRKLAMGAWFRWQFGFLAHFRHAITPLGRLVF
jgi:hypothetical protein